MHRVLVGIGAVWLGLCLSGLVAVARHAAAPGAPAAEQDRWPVSSLLERAADRPTLVVLLHAACPCSRATLRELERTLARTGESVRAHVVVVVPRGGAPADTAALETGAASLASAAEAIPRVRVTRDPAGVEAARFGARTSGTALLYDTSGAVRFMGGLTPGRGHEGANAGADAVVDLARGRAPSTGRTPVFGCSLDPGGTP